MPSRLAISSAASPEARRNALSRLPISSKRIAMGHAKFWARQFLAASRRSRHSKNDLTLLRCAGGGPRVEHGSERLLVVGRIAGDNRQAVHESGRRDDEVRLRKRMAGFAAVFDQNPPLEHPLLGARQHALLEHRPHFVRKPIRELGATRGITEKLDAEAYLGKRDDTDIEPFERLRRDEGENPGLWL